MPFELVSDYKPAGDQPQAIEKLAAGVQKGCRQTLLGVTGSGKTYTIANVIAKTGKKTLVISHNKTLAAQLYSELKQFFPKNKVGYFVSYYDYYQPESYIPATDTYIEKDVDVNEKIEQMRIAASAGLLSRDDVIIVATVSAIYGLVSPADYMAMSYELKVGQKITRQKLLRALVQMQYGRNELDLVPGKFRARGDTIDVFPMYGTGSFIRISLLGDEIESISEHDCLNGRKISSVPALRIFPAKLFVIPQERILRALDGIRAELAERLPQLAELERHRLKQRTEYDLEMLKNTGHCNGIENYSRYMDVRAAGEPPHCLLDFFGNDFLVVVDESHMTLPQVAGMQRGDHSRKKNLVDYGFRLPSAYDNRPLTFSEFEKYTKNAIYVSATPAQYEFEHSEQVVEQLVRPTGLLDPKPEVRPTVGQVDDLVRELRELEKKGWRAFVTTLTKRMAEDLTDYLVREGVKARYLHSEIETLERTDIIRRLRLGEFNVLVGINLLREGLDVPEVALVAVFDADKEGFLRNERSLIQVFGRAARNVDGKVIMYADRTTDSMRKAMDETMRRRAVQEKHNKEHGITPKTIIKAVERTEAEVAQTRNYARSELARLIVDTEAQMKNAADLMDFETAITLRDKLSELRKQMTQKVKKEEYQKEKIGAKRAARAK
jgi:excinuclease ABC subunit B